MIPILATRTNLAKTEPVAPSPDTAGMEKSLVEQTASLLTMFAGVIAMLMLSAVAIQTLLAKNAP